MARLALLAAIVLLVGTGLSLAGERIVFKNGHTIDAKWTRIEGDFIYLTMEDGSEIGFPKALVKETEKRKIIRVTGVNRGWGGRGPSFQETEGLRRHMVQMGRPGLLIEGISARTGKRDGMPNTYGFTASGGFKLRDELKRRDATPVVDLFDPTVREGGIGVPLKSDPDAVPRGAARAAAQQKPERRQPRIQPRMAAGRSAEE